MKLIYIAGKFTAATAPEIERNIDRAEAMARELIEQTESVAVLVPHSLGRRFMAGPGSPEYWYRATLEMASRCDAVLLVPGWTESRGVREYELPHFQGAGKPVFFSVEEVLAALTKGDL